VVGSKSQVAAIFEVDGGGGGKRGRRGISDDLGGLLGQKPVQRKLPAIRAGKR
jgi:hypothetical protein